MKNLISKLILYVLFILGVSASLEAAIISGSTSISRCVQETYVITVTNSHPTDPACLIDVTNTLPNSDFSFVASSSVITLHDTTTIVTNPGVSGNDLNWDIDLLNGSAYQLPASQSLTIQFNIETNCNTISGTNQTVIDYERCTNPGVALQDSENISIQVLPGDITFTSSPEVASASVGDNVTFTIEVKGTGLGESTNVVITNVLESGLTFVSSPNGNNSGQTTTWSAAEVAALASVDNGDTVTLTLVARVDDCENLGLTTDGIFGCNGTNCYDSITAGETVESSIQLVPRKPLLIFTPGNISIPYCSTGVTHSIAVQNTGTGPASNVRICTDFSALTISNVQGGATWNGSCFTLPDIAAGNTFNLEFDATLTDWCTDPSGSTVVYEPLYEDECDNPFFPPVQVGNYSISGGTTNLSVSKSGSAEVQIGDTITYNIQVTHSGPINCGSSTTGNVTITDTLPSGFTVTNAGGGVWTPGGGGTGGTIVWTFDPSVVSTLNTNITLQVPSQTQCETFCFTTFTNNLSATVTDCCGCTITESESVTTAIECEQLLNSERTISPATIEKCQSVTVTNTYIFEDDASLDSVLLTELIFTDNADNELDFVIGSLTMTFNGGNVTGTINDTTSGAGGSLVVTNIGSGVSVRNGTLVITYELDTENTPPSPPCGTSSTFFSWASLDLGVNAPTGQCLQDGTVFETDQITVQPPAMTVDVTGLDTILSQCDSDTITITLNQTSSVATPRDVRLVLSNTNYFAVDTSTTVCGGDVTPTNCTSPNVLANGLEWIFEDLFLGGTTATLQLDVTKKCGTVKDLVATAFFDDLCNDDAVSDNICSVSGTDSPQLLTTGDILIELTPESIFATQNQATWTIYVTNRGSGNAHNVNVTSTLGAGLSYNTSSISPNTSTSITPGTPANGVTWTIDLMAPGEQRVITQVVDIIDCNNLTNAVAGSWGCDGDTCQTITPVNSTVSISETKIAVSNTAGATFDICKANTVTITMKNTGQGTVYTTSTTDTLPTGTSYVAGTTQWRLNGAAYVAGGEPSISGQDLTWTSTDIPGLATLNPEDTIDIQFMAETDCDFVGGNFENETTFQTPCGEVNTSSAGLFTVSTNAPSISGTLTRTSPATGQAIDCGSNASWEIEVTNNGTVEAEVVWIEHTMENGFSYVSSTGDGTFGPSDNGFNNYGGNPLLTVWELRNLSPGATATLTITAQSVVGGGNCENLDTSVEIFFGCGSTDGNSNTKPGTDEGNSCLQTNSVMLSSSESRDPNLNLSTTVTPSAIPACGGPRTLTVTITNPSATSSAFNLDAQLTLPANISYVPGSASITCPAGNPGRASDEPSISGQQLTFHNVASQTNNVCNDSGQDQLGPGESIQISFDVNASCYTSSNLSLDVFYYDCCGTTQHSNSSTPPLSVNGIPTLDINITPASATGNCGSSNTWNVEVSNTGTINADFVLVELTTGSDLVPQSASNVTHGGCTSSIAAISGSLVVMEIKDLLAGETVDFDYTTQFNAPPNNCSVANRTVTGEVFWGCDGDNNIDCDAATTADRDCTHPTAADTDSSVVLIPELSVNALNLSCNPDGSVTVSGTVRNNGTGTASSVNIDIFEGVNLIADNLATTPANIAAGSTGTYSFTSSILPTGTSHSFRVVADPDNTVCECDESNNESTSSVTCSAPVLAVTKTLPSLLRNGSTINSPTHIEVGDLLNYQVQIQNTGSSTAYNVELRDVLPTPNALFSYVNGSSTATWPDAASPLTTNPTGTGTSGSPLTWIWEVATNRQVILEPSETLTLTYNVQVANTGILEGTTYTNTATTTGEDGSGQDLIDASDTASIDGGEASLNMDKDIIDIRRGGSSIGTAGPILPGDIIVYQAVVRNVGDGTASQVQLADTLPTGVEYETALGDGTYTVDNPAAGPTTLGIADGTTTSFNATINATINGGGALTATFRVLVQSSVSQCSDLTNVMQVTGQDLGGTAIPVSNVRTGDTSDPDPDDADADDIGQETIAVAKPDLTVNALNLVCNDDGSVVISGTVRNGGDGLATAVNIDIFEGANLIADNLATTPTNITAGSTGTYSFTSAILPTGTSHSFRVVADPSDTICEDDETNNEATSSVTCSVPVLSLTKTLPSLVRDGSTINSPTHIEVGDRLNYQVQIQNTGGSTAYNVELRDVLPTPNALFSYVNGSSTATWPDTASPLTTNPTGTGTSGSPLTWIWEVATDRQVILEPTETLTLTYSIQIANTGVQEGTTYTNTATTTGEDGSGQDLADDSDTVSIDGGEASLNMDKDIIDIRRGGSSVGTAGPVEPGDIIVYQVVVQNVGDGTASQVQLADTLPAGVEYETALGDGTYTVDNPAAGPTTLGIADGTTTSFNAAINATINGGGTLTATFRVLVGNGAQQGTNLTNLMQVTGQDLGGIAIPASNVRTGDTSDPDPDDADADDIGQETIAVGRPGLRVDKRATDIVRGGSSIGVSGNTVQPGDIIVYQYTITNPGNGTAYNVNFTDTMSSGVEYDTSITDGTYTVDNPAVGATTLGIADGTTTSFTTAINATIAGGATLAATYRVLATSLILQSNTTDNSAEASGVDGLGTAIPDANSNVGDTSDTDTEDPDADDTGIESLPTAKPGLSVNKVIDDVIRGGQNIGNKGPVQVDDIIIYRYVITNVGSGIAYNVNFTDTLPTGLEYDTDVADGTYSIDSPAVATTTLGIADGTTGTFTTTINETINGAGIFTGIYRAIVTSSVPQGVKLINSAMASGEDGAGTAIPPSNADVGDTSDSDVEDPDADDTGTSSILSPIPGFNTDKTIVAINGGSVKSVVEIGDKVRYRYTVENIAAGDAVDVDVLDTLPSGFKYIAGSATFTLPTQTTSLEPQVSGRDLFWNLSTTLLGGSPKGQSLSLEYEALVTSDVKNETLSNVASATGKDRSGNPVRKVALDPDEIDTDDSDTTSISGVNFPKLSFDKKLVSIDGGSRTTAVIGSLIEYELVATNIGKGTAYNVKITEALPQGTEYVVGQPVTNLGTIGGKKSKSAKIIIRITDNFDTSKTEITNIAVLEGEDKEGGDLDSQTDLVTVPFELDQQLSIPLPNSNSVCCLRVSKELRDVHQLLEHSPVDRTLYYLTDQSMYASTELFLLSKMNDDSPDNNVFDEQLRKAKIYSINNLLHVTLKSGLGLPLWGSSYSFDDYYTKSEKKVGDWKKENLFTTEEEIQPVWLEYAGGKPLYESNNSSQWTKTKQDQKIVAAAVGQSWIRQAYQLEEYLNSSLKKDQFLAQIIKRQLDAKMISLKKHLLHSYSQNSTYYVPHSFEFSPSSRKKNILRKNNESSLLYDQASILGALSKTSQVYKNNDLKMKVNAEKVIEKIIDHISKNHFNEDRALYDISASGEKLSNTAFSKMILILSLESILDNQTGTSVSDRAKDLLQRSLENVVKDIEDLLDRSSFSQDDTLLEWSSYLRILIVGTKYGDTSRYSSLAKKMYQLIESELWQSEKALYLTSVNEFDQSTYTPQVIGTVLGALREYSEKSKEKNRIRQRITYLIERLLTQAGIQLEGRSEGNSNYDHYLSPESKSGQSKVSHLLIPSKIEETDGNLPPVMIEKIVIRDTQINQRGQALDSQDLGSNQPKQIMRAVVWDPHFYLGKGMLLQDILNNFSLELDTYYKNSPISIEISDVDYYSKIIPLRLENQLEHFYLHSKSGATQDVMHKESRDGNSIFLGKGRSMPYFESDVFQGWLNTENETKIDLSLFDIGQSFLTLDSWLGHSRETADRKKIKQFKEILVAQEEYLMKVLSGSPPQEWPSNLELTVDSRGRIIHSEKKYNQSESDLLGQSSVLAVLAKVGRLGSFQSEDIYTWIDEASVGISELEISSQAIIIRNLEIVNKYSSDFNQKLRQLFERIAQEVEDRNVDRNATSVADYFAQIYILINSFDETENSSHMNKAKKLLREVEKNLWDDSRGLYLLENIKKSSKDQKIIRYSEWDLSLMLATFNKMSVHLERNDFRRSLSRMIQFYKRVFEKGGLHQYAKRANQLKGDRWITDTYLHTVSELALIESNDKAISDGSVLNYRIYVDNNCPDMHSSNGSALYNLVIKDELSSGLEFKPLRVRTSSKDIKLSSVSKNKSIWTLPKLEYGRSHWIDYQVKVKTNYSGNEYVNLVKVSGFDSQRIYCISEDEHQVEMSKEFIKFRVNTFIDENRNDIANSSEKSVSRVSVFVNGRFVGYTNSQGVLSLTLPRNKISVVSIQQNHSQRSNIVFPTFYKIIQPGTEQSLEKNIYFPAVKKYLIQGFIYFDQNNNYIREASEPVAQKLKVNIFGTDISSYSGIDGYFKMNSWKEIKDIESTIAISSSQEFNDQDTENMRIDIIGNK